MNHQFKDQAVVTSTWTITSTCSTPVDSAFPGNQQFKFYRVDDDNLRGWDEQRFAHRRRICEIGCYDLQGVDSVFLYPYAQGRQLDSLVAEMKQAGVNKVVVLSTIDTTRTEQFVEFNKRFHLRVGTSPIVRQNRRFRRTRGDGDRKGGHHVSSTYPLHHRERRGNLHTVDPRGLRQVARPPTAPQPAAAPGPPDHEGSTKCAAHR